MPMTRTQSLNRQQQCILRYSKTKCFNAKRNTNLVCTTIILHNTNNSNTLSASRPVRKIGSNKSRSEHFSIFQTIKTSRSCRNEELLDHHRRPDAEKTPLENSDRNTSNMIDLNLQTTPEQDPGHPTMKGVNTSRKYLAPAPT